MAISRKRKKELRKLQNQATTLWESQQVLLNQANEVAREAGRQLGKLNTEHVVPAVHGTYDKYAAPYVDKGVSASRRAYNQGLIPAAGAVVGSALSVLDAANDKRARLAAGRGFGSVDYAALSKSAEKYGKQATRKFQGLAAVPEPKAGIGAGGVIAIILGAAAALGVLYAAWQTLRADDELWVADDPLRAPDA